MSWHTSRAIVRQAVHILKILFRSGDMNSSIGKTFWQVLHPLRFEISIFACGVQEGSAVGVSGGEVGDNEFRSIAQGLPKANSICGKCGALEMGFWSDKEEGI